MKRLGIFLTVGMIAVSTAPRAYAQQSSQGAAQRQAAAEALFREAIKLMESKKFAEACPKLEESDRFDHGAGTAFKLAECYEGLGKIASAWSNFVVLADELKQRGDAREPEARARAEALEPRIPTLTFVVPAEAAKLPDFSVRRDGITVRKTLWDQPLPVDPGPHKVEATAKGKKPWTQTIVVREKETVKVSVPGLEAMLEVATDGSMPAQRIGAIVAGGAGVAGLVVGSIFGIGTISKWNGIDEQCRDETRPCTDAEIAKGNEAETWGLISTVSFIAGGVGIAAAGVLWFTAPGDRPRRERAAWEFTPVVAPNNIAGVLRGTF